MLVALLAGCHLLVPLGGTKDGAVVTPEAGLDSLPTLEHLPMVEAFVEADSSFCIENPKINGPKVPCDTQCVDPTIDEDCDGLVDAVDPSPPPACNQLLAKEEFPGAVPPIGFKTSGTPDCGVVRIVGSGTLTATNAFLSSIPGGEIVVEVGFRLVASDGSSANAVAIEVTHLDDTKHVCRVNLGTEGGVSMRLYDPTGVCGGDSGLNAMWSFAAPPGSYRLVYHHPGSWPYCQLLPPGVSKKEIFGFNCPPQELKALEIKVLNLEVELDHVRVFKFIQ